KSAKFTLLPSGVAPRGYGVPERTRGAAGAIVSGTRPAGKQGAQGGAGQARRPGLAVAGDGLAAHAGAVPDIAPTVVLAIGIDRLDVVAVAGDADPIPLADDGSEVGRAQDDAALVPREAAEGHHAVVGVRAVHPAEARGIGVSLVQRGLALVQPVEVGDQPL